MEARELFRGLIGDVISPLLTEVENLEMKSTELKSEIAGLNAKVEKLEETQDFFDQEQRKCNLIIVNQWIEERGDIKTFCARELQFDLDEKECLRIGKTTGVSYAYIDKI